MKSIGYIVFDLDGTLIDSSGGVVDAVNYSLREMGQPEQPPERIKRFIGYPLSQMYPEFTDASLDELHHHFQIRAAETMATSTVALDGVQTVLEQLKRMDYRLAIATTKIRIHVDSIIAKFNWNSFFDVFVGGDEVRQVKPAPDAFRLALKRLGVDARDAVVVGDTINDVLAAQAVPMPVIAVNSPYGGKDTILAARPDHFIQSISQLPDLLREGVVTKSQAK